MLLQRIAAGDSTAVNQCLEQYGNLVWSTAKRWSASISDAEDAVQEIFIDLWKSACRFDPDVSSEATFVMMVARRRLIDRRRRRRISAEHLDGEVCERCASDQPTPGERLELCEEATMAAELLNELKDEERKVLELSVHEGLSHQEIANRVGMPLGSVKSNIRRGLGRLRERLTKLSLAGSSRERL